MKLMQSIAIENNLSETAFVRSLADNRYEIRWFSPITEIDFCGHATLASAYVLFNEYGCSGEIEFITHKVGSLAVRQYADGRLEMSFPQQPPEPVRDIPAALLAGLSNKPQQVLKNQQAYVVVFAHEADIVRMTYSSAQLKLLAPYDVVITSQGSVYDFIVRYFWPANGGDEDPVTGSIYAALAPYWSKQLGKVDLVAHQASTRGGIVHCTVTEDRVLVAGHAALYLKGVVTIAD